MMQRLSLLLPSPQAGCSGHRAPQMTRMLLSAASTRRSDWPASAAARSMRKVLTARPQDRQEWCTVVGLATQDIMRTMMSRRSCSQPAATALPVRASSASPTPPTSPTWGGTLLLALCSGRHPSAWGFLAYGTRQRNGGSARQRYKSNKRAHGGLIPAKK